MPMSRTIPPLLALALIALLTACAQTGGPPAESDAGLLASPATPALAPLLPASAPAPAASAASDDQAGTASIVIHGNDRLYSAQRPPDNPPAQAISRLQFENAPVGEVVNVMLRDLLKVDYVIHPPLNGAITLTTRQTIDADRALLLLETALQANGIVMARDSRGTYHVGTPDALRGIVSAPVMAEPGKPLPPGYGAVIIPLQYLGAGEMANIMRPLISADAILRVDTVRNILVMRGTRAETEGWLDLVKTFDVNLLRGMSVGVFPLKHTSAADVDAALRLLSGASAQAPGGGAAAAPTAPALARPAVGGAARPGMAAPAPAGAAAAAQSAIGENNPLFGAVRILPIERLNAVMVVTPRAAYLDEIRYWIEQFDQPNINSGEPQLFVYKVQNGSANHLAELINGIYGGVAPGQPGGPTGATGVAPGLGTSRGNTGSPFGSSNYSTGSSFGGGGGGLFGGGSSFGGGGFGSSNFGGGSSFGSGGGLGGGGGLFGGNRAGGMNQQGQQGAQGGVSTVQLGQSVRVMADNINNTMLIYATPNEYARIESTLKRLDVPRAQVLIEASIIEVTLTDNLQYGLQWAFSGGLGGHGYNGAGVVGGPAGPGSILGADGSSNSNGFTYSLFNSAGQIKGVLNALASKSLVRVISNPSLMVLDNHTATIQVGDQIPISTGTTYYNYDGGSSPTYNYQYKDTGVMLGVTPSVSAGDLVSLDIDQIVTDIGPDPGLGGNPTFMQREINSQVAVRSGETMVLGGLIKDNAARTTNGLPILSSLPVIGGLFGAKNNTLTRTELLVILTPRVVRSDEEVRAVSRELRNRMSGLTAADLPAVPGQGVNQK